MRRGAPRRFWTPEEDEQLRALYPDARTEDLVGVLGRSRSAISGRAALLGVRKSEAFFESDRSGRVLRGHASPRIIATRFAKGSTPWNKGAKGSACHPNSCRTQFKKGTVNGRAAERVQPIGAERVTADGLLQRKVNNDLPLQRRWRSVHSIVWEEAHGQIPRGHKVVFLPGQRTNVAAEITPDKLELVTFAELMRRNSCHARYPRELCLLIQLRGALHRKINRLLKAGENP